VATAPLLGSVGGPDTWHEAAAVDSRAKPASLIASAGGRKGACEKNRVH